MESLRSSCTGARIFISRCFSGWMDRPLFMNTAFSGPLQCAVHSSVHSQHRFLRPISPIQRVSCKLLGHVECIGIELLHRGDVRSICNSAYPHALFHLDRPSVSVVIRTFSSNEDKPQYDFLRPYIALNPTFRSAQDVTKVRTLEMLSKTDWSFFSSVLPDAIAGSTDWFKLELFRRFLSLRWDDLMYLMDSAGLLRDPRTIRILASVIEERRINRIMGIRQVVRDPDHRRFLGFLLNSAGRDQLFSLIRIQFPQADPASLSLRWIAEIFREARNGIKLLPQHLIQLELSLSGKSTAEERQRNWSFTVENCSFQTLTRSFAGGIFDAIFK